jgi:hypothetical protein
MYFDGSDVSMGGTDLDAFELLADGSLLLSFDASTLTLPGVGAVEDKDIVRFVPTSTGPVTAGTYSLYFDGSDVGLNLKDEDIDAIEVAADGTILISTIGPVSVPAVTGNDEDLLAFTPTSLGSTTSGTWAFYFDGSDVGLNDTSDEEINGVWLDPANGELYLTTLGVFAVTGVSGTGADIFICTPSSLGANTVCAFRMFWDASANGYPSSDADAIVISR